MMQGTGVIRMVLGGMSVVWDFRVVDVSAKTSGWKTTDVGGSKGILMVVRRLMPTRLMMAVVGGLTPARLMAMGGLAPARLKAVVDGKGY